MTEKQELIDAGYHQLTEPYDIDTEYEMFISATIQAGKNGGSFRLLWEGPLSVTIWTKPQHIIPPENE